MSRYIDADKMLADIKSDHLISDGFKLTLERIVSRQDIVNAIDESWVVKQIQETCGAESSYYSRLLHKWREENEE